MSNQDTFVSKTDQSSAAKGEIDLNDHIEVRLLRVGSWLIGSDWRYADLHAPYWRLYCNQQDGARIHPRGAPTIALTAGRRYLIPPWIHFSSDSRDHVAHMYCHFDILGLPGASIREWFPRPLRLRADSHLEQAFFLLGNAVANDARITPGRACAWKAAAHAALAEALDSLPEREQQRLLQHTRGDLPLRHALDHIHGRLDADLSNAVLAARCKLSTDHLIRLFRRHLGQTPVHYVQERRLAAAARDLGHGDDSIEAIAERYGFANRFYFTRVFTRRMGQAPATWRKLQQEAAGHR